MRAKAGVLALPTEVASARQDWVRHGVHAGGVAALVELVPVLLIQGLALNVPPVRIFQSIASGALGREAYAQGWASAALGAGFHVLIAVVAGVVFAGAAIRLPRLVRHPVLAGMLFGIATFLVMTYVVVPLSAAAFPPARNPALIAVSLLVHIVSFGLPIAFVLRRRLNTSPGTRR